MYHDVGDDPAVEGFFAAPDKGERLEREDRSFRLLGELPDLEVVEAVWYPWSMPRQRFGTPAARLSIMRHMCGRFGMGSLSESRSISTPQRRLLPTAWISPARVTGGPYKALACARDPE